MPVFGGINKERIQDIIGATLVSGANTTITYNDAAGTVTISTDASSGEANTASNLGVTTYGLYKSKVGVDLKFKSITAGSSKVVLTSNTNDVALDISESNLTISNMAGTLAYDHGGTGFTSYTKGDVIHASATNTLAKLAIGTSGQYLKVVSGDVAWATIDASEILPSYSGNGSKYLQLNSGATALAWVTGPSGEANTASNVGVTTYGLFKAKSGVDLTFKSLTATSSKISLSANTNDVGIDVVEANLTISNMTGTLAVGHGGSGATTLTGVIIGNGTSAFTTVTAPSGTIVGTSDTQSLTNKTLGSGSKVLVGSDATGDLWYNGGSGVVTRIPIGSTNQLMTVIAGVPTWHDAPGWSTLTPSDIPNLEDLLGNLDVASGGTGFGSYTVGDLLYASGSTALSKLGHGSDGQFLRQHLAIGVYSPEWASIGASDIPNLQSLNGTLTAAKGGTGHASYTAGDLLTATGTTTLSSIGIGSTGQVLTVVGGAPAWAAATGGISSIVTNAVDSGNPNEQVDPIVTHGSTTRFRRIYGSGAISVTVVDDGDPTTSKIWVFFMGGSVDINSITGGGALAAYNGGTGFTSYAAGDLLYASNTSTLTTLAAGTDGQVLTLASGMPTWADATGGITSISSNDTDVSYPQEQVDLIVVSGADTKLRRIFGSSGINVTVVDDGDPTLSKIWVYFDGSQVEINSITGGSPLSYALGGTGIDTYTTGDMLYSPDGTSLSALPIGTANQILAVSGGVPTWINSGDITGDGLRVFRIAFSNANYTVGTYETYENLIVQVGTMSAVRTVTMWSANTHNKSEMIIKDESGTVSSTNYILIAFQSGETCDGFDTVSIKAPYGFVRLYSNGTNWFTSSSSLN